MSNSENRSIAATEEKLAKARRRQKEAAESASVTGSWQAFREADAEVLKFERELSAAKGEQYAEPIDFPVKWDVGAPLPHLMTNGHHTLLAFYLRVPNPGWDGRSVKIVSPNSGEIESLAIVEFFHCRSVRFGGPNDEVHHGHPLYGRGLDAYTAQVVRNSLWLAELEKINSVHRGYKSEYWRMVNHFILWFHDETFECLAESFKVETRQCSMKELLVEVSERLVF